MQLDITLIFKGQNSLKVAQIVLHVLKLQISLGEDKTRLDRKLIQFLARSAQHETGSRYIQLCSTLIVGTY